MMTATLFPKNVRGIICLDTAPTGTASDKKQMTLNTLETIKKLDVVGKTRNQAMDIIKEKFTDKGIANFISNNLVYTAADDHQTV